MTGDRLAVLLAGAEIGMVRQTAANSFAFTYRDEWRAFQDTIPLSLSMPLTLSRYGHRPLSAFLWGLLPDNEAILDRWARRFQVSARNPFALIAEVGEDCAGAVQFVRPERLAAISGGDIEVEWLDETAIGDRLRTLRSDPAAWRAAEDWGQFSLAGAQPKTALLRQGDRWGIPAGRTPTTHILKPPTGEFDGHAENEHFCLALARALEMPTATSAVMRFGGEVAIVVERYDRASTSTMLAAEAAASAAFAAGADASAFVRSVARVASLAALTNTQPILRLHQEDMCQALGLMPTAKYQNEGGPSPADIVTLLRDRSNRPDEDVGAFVDALIFNWLIGGTDAHAKNYSILHGSRGQVRLAPFYDLASALPYPQIDPQRLRMAMKIGGEYRLRDVGRRQWQAFALDAQLDGDAILRRALELADGIVAVTPGLGSILRQQGLDHPIIPTLVASLTERAAKCTRLLSP